jgi:hypothetical protein
MPNIKFKAFGVPFWMEYKAHDYDDIEILSITAEDSEIDLRDLLRDSVENLALEAAMDDYAEYQAEKSLDAYKRYKLGDSY